MYGRLLCRRWRLLGNKLGISNPSELKEAEENIVAREGLHIIEEDLSSATLDFSFLKHLHKRLFGKIYPFVDQIRTVNITKCYSSIPFCYVDFIEQEANHEEIIKADKQAFLGNDKFIKEMYNKIVEKIDGELVENLVA